MNFNHCPNCREVPGGFFGGAFFDVWECDNCELCYCYKCGPTNCPNCGSKQAHKVGLVWAK